MKTKKNLLNTTVTLTNDFDDESNENFDAVSNGVYIYKICPECGKPHTSSKGKNCLYCGAIFEEEIIEESKTIIEKVRAYCNGDSTYINDIYEEGYKVLKKMVYRKTQNLMEAEDRAQIGMINFFKTDLSNMDPEKFYGYLKTTAYHCSCDYFRAPTFITSVDNRATLALDEPLEGEENEMKYELEDKSVKVSGYEFSNSYMQMAVDRLKEEERTVLMMKYVECKKIREIAEELDISQSTVTGRLQQGKLHLAQEMSAIRNKENIALDDVFEN